MIRFPRYFDAYGGLNEMVKSRYFFAAIIVTAIASRFFTTPKWWDLSVSVVPGLVGFSIAGVAIFVSLSSESLRAVIAGKRPGCCKESPFMKFMAMFTHFIVIQLLALFFSILAKALFEAKVIPNNPLAPLAEDLKHPFWLLGGFFFIYAVFLCVALAVEIYRLASMIDDFQTNENEINASQSSARHGDD